MEMNDVLASRYNIWNKIWIVARIQSIRKYDQDEIEN